MKLSSQPIRMKVAAHLDELMSKSRGQACKGATMYTSIFKTAALLLEEGSAETRTHAKRIVFALKRFLPHATLQDLVPHAGSALRERRILATLEQLGPPEVPPRLAQAYAFAVGWDAVEDYARILNVPKPAQEDTMSSHVALRGDQMARDGSLSRAASTAMAPGGSGQLRRAGSRAHSVAPPLSRLPSQRAVPPARAPGPSRTDAISADLTLQATGSGIPGRVTEGSGDDRRPSYAASTRQRLRR